MSLRDEGFRFTYRPGVSLPYGWRHPTDTKPGDVDCTGMNDAEFEAFYQANPVDAVPYVVCGDLA